MEKLQSFLKRFGDNGRTRSWLGPRPDVRDRRVPGAIAAMVGYPTSQPDWFQLYKLDQVDRPTAEKLLAFVATTSLAYGNYGPPREGYRVMAADALKDFGPEAVFLTNSADWVAGPNVSCRNWPIGTSTFEAGLIAYDDRWAFIFWVEEED